jgi:hypothetical protein
VAQVVNNTPDVENRSRRSIRPLLTHASTNFGFRSRSMVNMAIADSYLWAAWLYLSYGKRLHAYTSLLRALQVRLIISLRPVRHALDWMRCSSRRFNRIYTGLDFIGVTVSKAV